MLIFKSRVIILLMIFQLIVAKVYDKCELAKDLYEVYGVPFEDVGTYVCIAERQSNFNTEAIGQGSYYGIYQISSEYWCEVSYSGKACGLDCSDLINDDLSDDLQCMRTIIGEHDRISGNGFSAWPSGISCQAQGSSYIADCSIESNQIVFSNDNIYTQQRKKSVSGNVGKVYERCELARELRFNYDIPRENIATWVCIAKHESNFNTSAIGRLNWDGSEDHGLFQISDLYWCGESGKACGLKCDELRDNDISNDVQCIRKIHEEHTRLSGDGFTAWAVYPRCKGQSDSFIDNCFDEEQNEVLLPFKPQPGIQQPPKPKISYQKSASNEEGKVYEQCELARELRDNHKIPYEQIATWVCIAKHESNFNTSAIGRLNWDGSEDHGLFQISDIYWCGETGKSCGLQCSELRDSDISNDVECIKKIYEEHTRLFGDGFNAWTVYKSKCKGKSEKYIKTCFDNENEVLPFTPIPGIQQHKKPYSSISSQRKSFQKIPEKGKIYEQCELAQELRYKHKIPMEQVATWVCIAKHESNFNTSAVGKLNSDGSKDHGMFQISDLWCSPPGQGTGCGLNCAELENNDITDDVKCMLKIFEEHRYLNNDGFTAWTVYKPHCQGRADSYIDGCFNDDENFILNTRPAITQPLSTRKPYWLATTTQEPTITEKLFDTTLIETTTIASRKTSSSFSSYVAKQLSTLRPLKQLQVTTNKINSKSTEKPLNLHLNSYQTSKLNNEVSAKKTVITNKPFTQPTKSPNTKNIIKSSSTTRLNRAQSISTTQKPILNISKPILQSQAKTTTRSTKRITATTLASTRSYKSLRSQTKPTQKTSTPAFNVFAFFLNDYTSKRPPIVYKPIEFGENSIKIFTKKSQIVATERLPLDSTTLKPLSFFNYYPLAQQNRIGRAGNITPHSIEYLLKLTTPRNWYG